MKKELDQNVGAQGTQKENDESVPFKNNSISRRRFVGMAATSAIGFTILPRHVLGGKGYIAPSDKITMGYIGTGTQGIRELLPMLGVPEIQVIAVCDPSKEARGYKDWSKEGLKNEIRKAIQKPDWEPGGDNTIPGGRDNGKSIVDTYYANVHPELKYKGCNSYADVRELLDKEKDLNAVKILTPDHLHGIISIAALKRGKHVIVHKPLSNRLLEGKKVIDMAKRYTTGPTVLYGHSILRYLLINHLCHKDWIGIYGWDPKPTVLTILIIRIWFSVAGTISVVVPWPIWVIIVYGRCSMHCN
jgi:hypothetical protein